MKDLVGCARRGICLALCAVALFLCYRSTTAILTVAGRAHNPTEGGIPADRGQVTARENMPRPAKQRLPAQMLRLKRVQETSPDPRLRRLLLLQESSPDRFVFLKVGIFVQVESELSKPQYLRLYLSASHCRTLSPPV